MVLTKEITINNQDIINLLERLQYETESRKEVISYMISTDGIQTPSFDIYEQRYQDAFIEYTAAKQELEKNYIFPNFEDKDKVISWNLDFSTHIVKVQYKE